MDAYTCMYIHYSDNNAGSDPVMIRVSFTILSPIRIYVSIMIRIFRITWLFSADLNNVGGPVRAWRLKAPRQDTANDTRWTDRRRELWARIERAAFADVWRKPSSQAHHTQQERAAAAIRNQHQNEERKKERTNDPSIYTFEYTLLYDSLF